MDISATQLIPHIPVPLDLAHFDHYDRPNCFDGISNIVQNFLLNASVEENIFFDCMIQDSFEWISILVNSKELDQSFTKYDFNTSCIIQSGVLTPKYEATKAKIDGFYQTLRPKPVIIYHGSFENLHKRYIYQRNQKTFLKITFLYPVSGDTKLENTIHHLIADTFNRLDNELSLPPSSRRKLKF